jgi:hypothetical protein
VWLLDELDNRLLVWRASRPNTVERSVPLPFFCKEFALGPAGTLYVARPRSLDPTWLYRLSGAGEVLWQSTLDTNLLNMQLRAGPSGTLYWTEPYESSTRPARGRRWTPAATPTGRSLSVSEQRRRTLWGYQPLPRGLRLVTAFLPYDELRFGLVDGAGRLVRSWRVTSRTRIAPVVEATPDVVGGDPVVFVEATRGSGARRTFRREYVVLRLAATAGGTRARFSLPGVGAASRVGGRDHRPPRRPRREALPARLVADHRSSHHPLLARPGRVTDSR